MHRLNEEQRFALEITSVIASMFDEDDENHQYDLNEIDLTKFFTGMLMAGNTLHRNFTGQSMDLFEFISVLNKLAHQYLVDVKEEE